MSAIGWLVVLPILAYLASVIVRDWRRGAFRATDPETDDGIAYGPAGFRLSWTDGEK